jgi:hypothetical protein
MGKRPGEGTLMSSVNARNGPEGRENADTSGGVLHEGPPGGHISASRSERLRHIRESRKAQARSARDLSAAGKAPNGVINIHVNGVQVGDSNVQHNYLDQRTRRRH